MGTEVAGQDIVNARHEATLMWLRVALFTSAQVMKGSHLAELRKLVGEIVETLDLAPEGW